MFNRSNPAGLALAFITIIVMAAAFLALSFGVGATPGHDGVPAAHKVYTCETYAEGPMPTDDVDGACYLPTIYQGSPTLDTGDYGTDIPRCASDDWNADHVARCYTQRVTDGAVLIIDASDTVIGTIK